MAEMIIFPVDGRTATGYLALPPQGKGPAVLVLHAWWGLNDFFKTVCDRLAQAGFVVLAPDLYAGKGVAKTIEEAKVLQPTANGDETYQTITAASSYLLGHTAASSKSVGVIGYSMGAYWALLLEGPVSAVVAFYGLSYLDNVTTNAPIIGHFAEDDEYEPVETVRPFEAGLRERGKDVNFYIYPGTHHWFFEADRPEYDAVAAQLAWERTIAFLSQHIK